MTQHLNEDLRFLTNSRLYKEFISERDEILRHKWIESEKAGRDIGFEKALLDWVIKYRSAWRQRKQANFEETQFQGGPSAAPSEQ